MATDEEVDELEVAIRSAFAAVPHPGSGNIARHDCDECEQLRQRLGTVTWQQLSADDVEAIYDELPLLTPDAYRHFLPAFLLTALRAIRPHPSVSARSSNVPMFTVFSLQTRVIYSSGQSPVSRDQLRAARRFLELMQSDEQLGLYGDAQEALKNFIENDS